MFRIYHDITNVEKEWITLYQANDTFSPYQSYEWNYNLFRRMKKLRTEKSRNTYCFIVYYNDNDQTPVIVAPIVVPKNGGEIFLFGDYLKSGTLNFIYPKDIEDKDFDLLFDYINELYPNRKFRLFEVPITTRMGQYLFDHEDKFSKFFNRDNVRSVVPQTEEELLAHLSKSVRQTIRTGYNRLQKAGLTSQLHIKPVGAKISIKERLAICRLHNARRKEWGYKIDNEHASILTKLKQFYRDIFLDPFFMFAKCKNFVYAKYTIGDELAAFFIAIKNDQGYCIVPTLVHDRKFDFYNPGLLMIYEYLKYQTASKEITIFDLSRGDETYKLRYLPYPETYNNGLYHFNG